MPGCLDAGCLDDRIGLDRGAACSVATPPICLECSTYSLFTHPGSTEGLPGSLYIICYLALRTSDLDLGGFSLVVSDGSVFSSFSFFSPRFFLLYSCLLLSFFRPNIFYLLSLFRSDASCSIFCECSLLTWSRSVGGLSDSCPSSAISVPQGLGAIPRHTS